MTADAITARDESFELIRDAILGWNPDVKIIWEGVPAPTLSDKDTWVRISMMHGPQGQASLAGEDGVRRWNRVGFISAQCFAPLASGSVKKATQLACVVRDALQGKQTASCVWFRNPRINEVGEDRAWFQVNATIDFDYDELR